MHQNVLILSRDAREYAALLEDLASDSLQFLPCEEGAALPAEAATARLCLADPGLLVPVLPKLPQLRWVQSTWAGVTPLLAAAREGLQVSGIKDVFGPQMAEYALGYMLAHVLERDERARAQAARRWYDAPTGTLRGRRLGVMGTGSIGAELARRCALFGMEPVGYSRSGRCHEPFVRVYDAAQLQAFLQELDVLVAVLPDTPATSELLDATALRALPSHAQLINVGRGSLIVEEDLLAVLAEGHLGEVVLDVFQQEPLPPEHDFWRAPRLRLTAHVAAQSWPADIARVFRENLLRYHRGAPLLYELDAARGY
ncbi:MAG: D-2-hydroxyacid dehydrogenase [Xanthomonadales bacterium]|nr:D-2-hydroxyacid dehydrogenase [Xanthomonadales bacterium]